MLRDLVGLLALKLDDLRWWVVSLPPDERIWKVAVLVALPPLVIIVVIALFRGTSGPR